MAELTVPEDLPFFPLRDHDLLVALNVHAQNIRMDVASLKLEVVKQQADFNERSEKLRQLVESKADSLAVEHLREQLQTKADAKEVETLREFRWMILGVVVGVQGLTGIGIFLWVQLHAH